MKKTINYLMFSILILFVGLFYVNAECSYQERKDLLNKANNIDAYFEADLDNNKFLFYLYNLDDDLFVELENLSSNDSISIYKYQYDTEFYTMEESNVNNIIKYKLTIFSNKNECYGNVIYTKSIKKGAINKFYNEDICNGIEDYKYCVPVLDTKFPISDEEVEKRINEYKKSLLVEEEVSVYEKFGIDDLIGLLKTYWYIPMIILVIVLIIFIVRFINKKRGEL